MFHSLLTASDFINNDLGSTDAPRDNKLLVDVNYNIRNHEVEEVGEFLRESMSNMAAI